METMEKEQGGIAMARRKKTSEDVTMATEVNAEVVEQTEVPAEAQAEVEAEVKAKKACKKTAKADKKEAKEEESGVNIVVEFNGTQRNVDEVVDKIKAEWVEAGHRVSTIKSLDVYIKPQDYTAYYVINGKVQGKVWM